MNATRTVDGITDEEGKGTLAMMQAEQTCAVCGEFGRLHCAGCDRTFCAEHVERHFAMGYFYLCAECTALQAAQQAQEGQTPKRSRRKRA
jgi:hypothetical protein